MIQCFWHVEGITVRKPLHHQPLSGLNSRIVTSRNVKKGRQVCNIMNTVLFKINSLSYGAAKSFLV